MEKEKARQDSHCYHWATYFLGLSEDEEIAWAIAMSMQAESDVF